jgi:hypothetical protein
LRTEAVKIINLTTRPIGHHHHRSCFFPHVDTGSTVSSIFRTLLGNPFLSKCQALSVIRPGSPQWYQTGVLSSSISFLKIEMSQGAKSRGYGVWGMTAILFFARNCWVRTKVWDCALWWWWWFVLAKFRGDVFARFHVVAAKLRSRTRNSQFGPLEPVLCATKIAV